MTAQYEVLKRDTAYVFIEPEMVKAGSIIETDMKPGPHLRPLNAEAEAAFEAWINEFTTFQLDPLTGLPKEDENGKKISYKPREQYRRRVAEPVTPHTMRIVANPPQPKQGESLATVAMGKATEWKRPDGDAPAPAPVAPVIDPTGGTKLLSVPATTKAA